MLSRGWPCVVEFKGASVAEVLLLLLLVGDLLGIELGDWLIALEWAVLSPKLVTSLAEGPDEEGLHVEKNEEAGEDHEGEENKSSTSSSPCSTCKSWN